MYRHCGAGWGAGSGRVGDHGGAVGDGAMGENLVPADVLRAVGVIVVLSSMVVMSRYGRWQMQPSRPTRSMISGKRSGVPIARAIQL
jgi:hypothetical protein